MLITLDWLYSRVTVSIFIAIFVFEFHFNQIKPIILSFESAYDAVVSIHCSVSSMSMCKTHKQTIVWCVVMWI